MLRMEFLDALRDARRELMASRDYRLLYRVLNNRDEKSFSEIKESLIKLQKLIRDNVELQKIKKNIKSYLDKISLYEKDLENRVEFQFSSPECSEILKKISLIYGEEPVNVERNGLGRNNLLYISLILSHLTGDESNVEDVFFRLIGIEEPEAHLHPHLQDHLARNIKAELECNKRLQIILTSHSTHISGKLDIENTVILYKGEDGNIDNHYILAGVGKTIEEQNTIRYLKKYLDATNSAMFFARRVILVEGISEQLLIPMFFYMEKQKTLGQTGCNVVNVSGVSFKHFLEIIKNGYFIKCLVLTDADIGTRTENRAKNLQEKYKQTKEIKVQSTSSPTFEKDIIQCNRNGKGKAILFNALTQTRTEKGKELKDSTGKLDINTDDFFQLIKDYKSEFAFNLIEELNKDQLGFSIPDYIIDGFNFIYPEVSENEDQE